ncbi:serine/threonine protein kinase, partial [Streptomyces nanshensis]
MARKIGSRYTAHRILGRGSAGTVWLGDGPEGPVAIKLLREDLASDQDLVERFVQERSALLCLDHPRVVGVRDLVVDGDELALVMDLVRGTDLRTRLERDRRLAPAAAVAVAADVADALAAAHAA